VRGPRPSWPRTGPPKLGAATPISVSTGTAAAAPTSQDKELAERIRAAAREDDAEDAEAARDRLLGLAPNELPVGWPADRVGDWRWDGSGWRHRWGGWR